jgi:hypothetical protein
MKDSQKKAALFCVLAFLAGLLVATSGCSVRTRGESPLGVMTTTLEVECCPCCGFTPWTDSWCENHYGT